MAPTKNRSIKPKVDVNNKILRYDEKEKLVRAILEEGPTDLDVLLPSVPNRTRDELLKYLNALKYEGKWCLESEDAEEPFIEQWLHSFHARDDRGGLEQDFSYLVCEYLTVIATQEDHPPPEACDGVDFRELYLYLAYLTKGLPPPKLKSKTSARFLYSVSSWLIDVADRKNLAKHAAYLNKCKAGIVPRVDAKVAKTRDDSLNLLHTPPKLLKLKKKDYAQELHKTSL